MKATADVARDPVTSTVELTPLEEHVVGRAQAYMLRIASSAWSAWLTTNNGKRWRKASRGGHKLGVRPHDYGYTTPEIIIEMQQALQNKDMETIKGIMVHYADGRR